MASAHSDVLAERDELQRRVNSMEQEIERLQQRLINVNSYHQAWVAHAQELEKQLEAVGAGGVEPLRRAKCLHQIAEPAAWLVNDPVAQNQYAVTSINDSQLVDDCTNNGAEALPLYTAPQPPAMAQPATASSAL